MKTSIHRTTTTLCTLNILHRLRGEDKYRRLRSVGASLELSTATVSTEGLLLFFRPPLPLCRSTSCPHFLSLSPSLSFSSFLFFSLRLSLSIGLLRFLAEKKLNARLPSSVARRQGTRRATGLFIDPSKHCRIMRSRRSVARDTLEDPIIIREVARSLFPRTSPSRGNLSIEPGERILHGWLNSWDRGLSIDCVLCAAVR